MSWTLIIMLAFGHEFNKAPVAVTIASVPGFTTEQACINASRRVSENLIPGWVSSDAKSSFTCVANGV